MRNCADEQLVFDYLKGDEGSLEVLIRRYLKPIYGFVYHMVGNVHDAEDVTQETFVKMWKHLKKFDSRKSFKTWLFSIAKNAALDFLKKKKAIPFSALDNEDGDNVMIDSIADSEALPSEIFDREDIASFLASAMAKLPPMYRAVLTLHYNEQLRFREIADVLGEPLDTVKSRHRRACSMLRKFLTSK